MFLILALILINFEKAVLTLSPQEMETTFYDDMIHRNANMENPLCYLSRGQKDTFCRDVFQLPQLKVTIEVEFNKQAFFRFEPMCSKRRLSFRTLNLPDGWEQNILPCFGRHRILRTSWYEDPFFDTFFVVLSQPLNIMYVLGDKRTGEKNDIYIIDVVKVKTNPLELPETKITEDENTLEEYLNGIEVHNTNIREVEAMYVRDMIRLEGDLLHVVDPFETMEAAKILTVCLSIFTEIRYTNQGIFIDRQSMFTLPHGPIQKSVYFLHEEKRNGHPQRTYPCRALHESLSTTKSLIVKDKYSIAAGGRKGSIFVFEMVNFAENVRPVGYIENFDFEHLLPSEPSETEIYPNAMQLLQNIQPTVPVS